MRLLGRNLSLVAGDLHLATSLSRDLEVAKQSSSVLQGESSPPPFFTAWGFVTFEACCCCSRRCSCLDDVPADDVLHTLVHIGDGQDITEDVPA